MFTRYFRKVDYCTIAKLMLVIPIICLGLASIALPLLIYKKANRSIMVNDSLKRITIDDLVVFNPFTPSTTGMNDTPLDEIKDKTHHAKLTSGLLPPIKEDLKP